MLNRFKQFEAKNIESMKLKDLIEYKNLSNSEKEYVKRNGLSEDMIFKKVSKKFAKNFLLMSKEEYAILSTTLTYPQDVLVKKISSFGKNKKGEILSVLKRIIDMEDFNEDGHHFRQAVSEMWYSPEVYMSYDENRVPKEMYSIPKNIKNNIKNEISLVLDQAFEEYINSITTSMQEVNINVTSKNIVRRNLYEATIILEMGDSHYKLTLSETYYYISNGDIILKQGSTNTLDIQSLIKLIKSFE